MKISILILAFCTAAIAHAQDDIPGGGKAEPPLPAVPPVVVPPDWNIHWDFHVVTLPTKLALPLLPELRDETTAVAGWEKVQALIAKDEAKVALATGGKIMQHAPTEFFQGEEVRYPIEFEGPDVLEPMRNVDVSKLPRAKPGEPISVGYGPSTFDVRKVGISLNVSGTVSEDGKRLRVESEVDHTWLLKWDEFDVGRMADNERLVYKQPRFASARRKSISGMLTGERALLSAHPLATDPERTELFFLQVWTTLRKKGETK